MFSIPQFHQFNCSNTLFTPLTLTLILTPTRHIYIGSRAPGIEPGPERSKPRALTTAFFFFFFISVYLFQVIYIFFYIIFFQNKRWILIVGWYRQEYRYAAVLRSHALLHSFLFFFFLRLLLLNKIKLSRCCAVPMYDILIYVLKAWTQKQDSSLA